MIFKKKINYLLKPLKIFLDYLNVMFEIYFYCDNYHKILCTNLCSNNIFIVKKKYAGNNPIVN